jgi:hypothetical protein
MNKNKSFLLGFFIIAVFGIVHVPVTHAASSFSSISQTGDGTGYKTTSAPLFSESIAYPSTLPDLPYNTIPTVGAPSAPTFSFTNPVQACDSLLARSGLPSTVSTYCVLQTAASYLYTFGWGYGYGFGNSSPPDPSTSLTGARFTGDLYQSPPLQATDLNAMVTDLQNYGLAYLLSGGNPGIPLPSYGDACPMAHQDALPFSITVASGRTCQIYFKAGAAPVLPVASLTAAPSSIAAGSNSLLTYSCSNAATSASINNGVGTVSPASGGSVSVSPSSTTTYTLTCTNASGSASQAATVSVTQLPDLTATVGGPLTVTQGTANSYGGTVTNIGTGGTGAGFENTMIIYAADQATWVAWQNVATGPLASGASIPFTSTITVPGGSGTYYYRLCADYGPTSGWVGTGVIAESNEANNCSGFGTITVQPAIPPSPTGLSNTCNAAGTQATISWTPTPGAVNYYVRVLDTVTAVINPNLDFYVPTSVTFATVPGRDYTWWVYSNNASGASAAPTTAYFVCTSQPDLIVPTIGPPVSVVQGGSYAFTGTVKNQAPASTGAAFENTMIIYDVDKITWLAWKNAPETTLSANGSSPRSITVALPPAITPGSYYYRLCADYGPTTSWAGNITESDEGNNCSNFAPLTVTAPLLPGLTCTANPTNVNTGGTVNFIITPVNGAIGPYTWHDSDGTTGSTVSPFFSRTYLTAPGVYQMDVKAKNMATTQTCTNQVTVTGTYCAVGPSVATIDAVPTRVKAGGYSTISWSASNVQGNGGTCTISGPGLNRTVPAGPPPSCLVDPDQATLQINQRSIYTITCTGGGTDSVTVNLVPQFKEF